MEYRKNEKGNTVISYGSKPKGNFVPKQDNESEAQWRGRILKEEIRKGNSSLETAIKLAEKMPDHSRWEFLQAVKGKDLW